jgi:hypothetical protein
MNRSRGAQYGATPHPDGDAAAMLPRRPNTVNVGPAS